MPKLQQRFSSIAVEIRAWNMNISYPLLWYSYLSMLCFNDGSAKLFQEKLRNRCNILVKQCNQYLFALWHMCTIQVCHTIWYVVVIYLANNSTKSTSHWLMPLIYTSIKLAYYTNDTIYCTRCLHSSTQFIDNFYRGIQWIVLRSTLEVHQVYSCSSIRDKRITHWELCFVWN